MQSLKGADERIVSPVGYGESIVVRRTTATAISLIVLLNIIVFCSKIYGQFLADDFTLFSRIESFLSEKSLIAVGLYGLYYRPVPPLAWLPLYTAFGPEPLYFHLFHLFLHIANAVLVFFLVKKIFRREDAFVAACLFSVLTAHLEAVQWVCIIFDVLSAQFCLLSVLSLVFFFETKRIVFYALSLSAAMLAILSKENAAALPILVILVSFVWNRQKEPNTRPLRSSVLPSVPYFLLFSAYILLRGRYLKAYGVATPSLPSLFHSSIVSNYHALFNDLLVPYYAGGLISQIEPFVMATFALCLIVCAYAVRESRGLILFGIGWVFVAALPTVLVVSQGFHRFNYLPSIGFCALLGGLLVTASQHLRNLRLAPLLPCMAIALYSVSTIVHTTSWLKAWRVSEAVQQSFLTDVAPVIEEPARAYFYEIPEMVDEISYFTVGLPECFSLLQKEGKRQYYAAVRWTRPKVGFPEQNQMEHGVWNYYRFAWDSSAMRFHHEGKVFRDSAARNPDDKVLFSWDFSQYRDFNRWEPANDLSFVYDMEAKAHKFVTTGSLSLLKSPFIGHRLKYVRLEFRALHPKETVLNGHLFWVTESDTTYDGKKCITFPLKADGLKHTYTLPLYINAWSLREPIFRLAFRLSERPDTLVDIGSVTIYSY